MYKDIISYELAENTSPEQLIKVARQVVNDWMKHQAGFIRWEIHSNSDGSYTDIVYWKSKEAAKESEKTMGDISNAAEWFGCYKEGTITSKNLSTIASFDA